MLSNFFLDDSSKSCISITTKHARRTADMNHDFQKYHEEDAVAMIIDVLCDVFGYKFVHQYDQELSSEKMNGSSYTKRELFLFQK